MRPLCTSTQINVQKTTEFDKDDNVVNEFYSVVSANNRSEDTADSVPNTSRNSIMPINNRGQRRVVADILDPTSPNYLTELSSIFRNSETQELTPEFSGYSNDSEIMGAYIITLINAIEFGHNKGEPFEGTEVYEAAGNEYLLFGRVGPLIDPETGLSLSDEIIQSRRTQAIRYSGALNSPTLPLGEFRNKSNGKTTSLFISLLYAEQYNPERITVSEHLNSDGNLVQSQTIWKLGVRIMESGLGLSQTTEHLTRVFSGDPDENPVCAVMGHLIRPRVSTGSIKSLGPALGRLMQRSNVAPANSKSETSDLDALMASGSSS